MSEPGFLRARLSARPEASGAASQGQRGRGGLGPRSHDVALSVGGGAAVAAALAVANYFLRDFVLAVAEPNPRLCGTTESFSGRGPSFGPATDEFGTGLFPEPFKKLGAAASSDGGRGKVRAQSAATSFVVVAAAAAAAVALRPLLSKRAVRLLCRENNT